MEDLQQYISDLKTILDQLPIELIDEVVERLYQARLEGNQVFIMGNGGSASTASHFVCDLAKNTRLEGWPSFRVIGLSDNMAIFSAYANDEGYEAVFADQLESLIREGDVVLSLSTSGNSMNVVRAVELANQHAATTIAFTGSPGGKLAKRAHLNLRVPRGSIEQVEDVHLVLEHMITKALRERLDEFSAREDEQRMDLAALKNRADPDAEGRSPEYARKLSALRAALHEVDLTNGRMEAYLLLAVRSVGARSGSLIVFDSEGNIVESFVAFAGEVREAEADRLIEIARSGLAGWVMRSGEPALVENTRQDDRWLARQWDRGRGSARSAISTPLISDDHIAGVLTLASNDDSRFTETDLSLLSSIGVLFSFQRVGAGAVNFPDRKREEFTATRVGTDEVPAD